VFAFGGGFMAFGGKLAGKQGLGGYFFTGVLAAVAATPCTAPFMGAAIGYALSQPPSVIFAVLIALGAGFSLPMIALGASPALQHILPRPGAWMETLKQVLAFPLYATVAWLVWVLTIQTGSDGVIAASVILIGVGFAAWLAGRLMLSALHFRLAAPVLAVLTLVSGYSLLPASGPGLPQTGAAQSPAHGPLTEPFSTARLKTLLQEGQPVFINLTAAWCITCKVNERIALSSKSIAKAFEDAGITYMKGDWTRQNPEITALLHQFGRAGVPLYLLYPSNGGAPKVLPQILTEAMVLNEINNLPSTNQTAKGA
jgi:thiol:disulfide interchange protein DsbD